MTIKRFLETGTSPSVDPESNLMGSGDNIREAPIFFPQHLAIAFLTAERFRHVWDYHSSFWIEFRSFMNTCL